MNNANISWKDIRGLFPSLLFALKALLIVIAIDLTISIIVGVGMSDALHFSRYVKDGDLGDNYYEDMMGYYFANELLIQKNKETGWSNTLNLWDSYEEGSEWAYDWEWNIDSLGAIRTPHEGEKVEVLHGNNAVFLLGSSVMAGWALKEKDRLAGALNSLGYNAFNFASIEYSVDQAYALYETALSKYKPAVLVVGIENEPEAISNMYTPFRWGSDSGAPYLKPAYHMTADGLVVKKYPPVDYQEQHNHAKMLAELREHDALFEEFEYYKFSTLPFTHMILSSYIWLDREIFGTDKFIKSFELQKYFMEKFVEQANEDGVEVIFVKLETSDEIEEAVDKPWYRRFFKGTNEIHTELLASTSMNVIFSAEVFIESDRPVYEFYRYYDNMHLSEDGCKLLAQRISEEIIRLSPPKEVH